MIQRHFWEVLRNLGVAGQGWLHPTKSICLRFIICLVTIATLRNLRERPISQRNPQTNWMSVFWSVTCFLCIGFGTFLFLYKLIILHSELYLIYLNFSDNLETLLADLSMPNHVQLKVVGLEVSFLCWMSIWKKSKTLIVYFQRYCWSQKPTIWLNETVADNLQFSILTYFQSGHLPRGNLRCDGLRAKTLRY